MTDSDHPVLDTLKTISVVEQLGRNLIEREMPHGLTMSQFIVLDHFVRRGVEMAPAELARAFHVTKGTMTSTLQRLAGKKFIKVSPDPTDGRAKRIGITPRGIKARDEAMTSIRPILDTMHARVGQQVLTDATGSLMQFLDFYRAGDK